MIENRTIISVSLEIVIRLFFISLQSCSSPCSFI
nr:MAG TPA: hypothetical protein [Caudoviricetes sp.]